MKPRNSTCSGRRGFLTLPSQSASQSSESNKILGTPFFSMAPSQSIEYPTNKLESWILFFALPLPVQTTLAENARTALARAAAAALFLSPLLDERPFAQSEQLRGLWREPSNQPP